jgi:cell division protein FtsI (penicillin-binding protein 3)
MTLDQVIAVSSNIGIVKLTSRLAPNEQFDVLRRFGIGSPTGIEFPGESRGRLALPHEWSGVTAASLAMGYELAVTPLQLAQAYAAIANDGVMVRPTLVKVIRSPGGVELYRHRPEPVRRVVTPAVARRLRQLLRGVVSLEGATGTTAALTNYEVAGKTGTSRKAGFGGYIPGAYTASFASLFPADQPQLVMVVKLDNPKGAYARLTAAPVTRSVLEQLLATQTGPLDRARLSGTAAAPGHVAPMDKETLPYVVAWPLSTGPVLMVGRAVPDVRGTRLRAAARQLHQQGLQARVKGWGRVVARDPAPGTIVSPGTAVELVATDR